LSLQKIKITDEGYILNVSYRKVRLLKLVFREISRNTGYHYFFMTNCFFAFELIILIIIIGLKKFDEFSKQPSLKCLTAQFQEIKL